LNVSFDEDKRLRVAKYIDENKNGTISLREFKKAFKVIYTHEDSWIQQAMESLCEALLKKGIHLRAAFEMISNGEELIDLEQFHEGLELLDFFQQHPQTKEQLQELFNIFDRDQNGFIDFREFLASLKIVDTEVEDKEKEEEGEEEKEEEEESPKKEKEKCKK